VLTEIKNRGTADVCIVVCEDHAEHEYMTLVAENPQWDTKRYDVAFSADYGSFESMADVLRQIGHDERVHKQGSLAAMKQPRFK
jgi:ubiquinol oxidase